MGLVFYPVLVSRCGVDTHQIMPFSMPWKRYHYRGSSTVAARNTLLQNLVSGLKKFRKAVCHRQQIQFVCLGGLPPIHPVESHSMVYCLPDESTHTSTHPCEVRITVINVSANAAPETRVKVAPSSTPVSPNFIFFMLYPRQAGGSQQAQYNPSN